MIGVKCHDEENDNDGDCKDGDGGGDHDHNDKNVSLLTFLVSEESVESFKHRSSK